MMRSTRAMSVSGGALLMILLAHSAGTQQQPTEKIGGDPSTIRQGQTGSGSPRAAPSGAWPMYRHDLAGTGYSPLTEVNTKNVSTLTQVWTYRLQGDAPAAA